MYLLCGTIVDERVVLLRAITENTGFHFSLPMICSSDDLHLGQALDFLTRRYLTSAFLAVLMRRSKLNFWNHLGKKPDFLSYRFGFRLFSAL